MAQAPEEKELNSEELPNLGGYDFSMLKDPEVARKIFESARCGICKKLPRKVVELSCDNHQDDMELPVYCEGCIQSYMAKNNNQCPCSHHPNATYHRNRALRKQISSLEVICPNSENHPSRQKLRVPLYPPFASLECSIAPF